MEGVEFSMNKPYKKAEVLLLMVFISFYVTADLASNVVLYKQVQVGPALFPGGVFVVPFIYCLSDVITEIFGYRIACYIIWLGITCDFLFVMFVEGIINLPSPSSWHMQGAFDAVLGSMLRANLASIAGIITGRFVNVYCLSKWKVFFLARCFFLRSLGSSAIGELVVIMIALPILFLGVIPLSDILKMGISEYVLRILYAFIISVPASYIVYLIKTKLGVDQIDRSINYNPFRLFS